MTMNLSLAHHFRAAVLLALPLIGSNIAHMLLNVTDTLMLGRYGIVPLAAGVLGSSTFFVVFVLGAGFPKAVMPLVAAAYGRQDDVQLRRVVRMAMWLATFFSTLIYPVFWFSGPILLLLGQEAETAQATQTYLRIVGFGIWPALIAMVLSFTLAAVGRPRVVFGVMLFALPTNVALNWGLIFGHWGAPELGVQGAAIATLITQSLSALLLALYAATHSKIRKYSLFTRIYKSDPVALREVFRLGWPLGLTGLSEAGLFHASALMMGAIGTVPLAAHGIALQISALTFMTHVGLSHAATIRTGQFFGQADYAQMRRGALASGILSLGLIFFTVIAFLGWPQLWIGLFLSADNPNRIEIIAMGAMLLGYAALFQLADGMQVLGLGLLAGVQDTRVPMVLTACAYWGAGIPASYLLAFTFDLGPAGIGLGLVLGLAVAATGLIWRFWGFLRARA